MAAGAQTISGVLPLLKEVTTKLGLMKQFDEGHFLLDIIEKGDQGSPKMVDMMAEYDGKYVRIDAHTAGNPNVGIGVGESSGYPLEGSQTYNNLKYRARRHVSSLGMTIEAMERAPGDPQSSFKVAAKEMSALLENTRAKMNKYLHEDGSSYICSGASSAGWDDSDNEFTVESGAASLFTAGMEIAVRHKTTGALATGFTGAPIKVVSADTGTDEILVTDKDGNNFSISDIADLSAYGFYPWDSQDKVIYGLGIACSESNPLVHGFDGSTTVTATDDAGMNRSFGAVDRTVAANSWWKAYAASNLGGNSVSIVNDIQPLEVALVGRDPTLKEANSIMAVSPGGIYYQIVNDLEVGKRTAVREKIIDGKYDVVRYGIFTFGWDPDAPANKVRFFAPKYFYRMIPQPWDFEDLDSKWTQMTDSYGRPTSKHRMNLVSSQQLVVASCLGNTEFTNVAA